jgi:DNA polymerase III delta subunit
MGLLRQISEEQDIGRVFSMIVRQFRLLLLTREAIDSGRDPRESLPWRTPDFVREKLIRQAHNFNHHDLKIAHHSLMQLDLDIKTGRGDLATGLDLFVLGLIRSPNEAG